MSHTLTRRDFIKTTAAAAGGMALEFTMPGEAFSAGKPAMAAPAEVTAWILIHPDDRVVVRIARSEMGQGTYTALAQLVAEELECDWNKVSAEYASPNEHVRRNRVWGSMSTGGSSGVRSSHDYVRQAGAAAREMLIGAAAAQWSVPASECTVDKGVISHAASKRRVSYGKVAADAAKREVPKNIKLKDAKDWKIAGQPKKRLDIPDKVMGKPIYAIDVNVPGMLHAAIAQCPVFGGKVKTVDESAIKGARGIKQVVKQGDYVAVLADNWWRANEALKKLKIEWDLGADANVSSESILAAFKAGLDDPKAVEAKKTGDVEMAFAAAAKTIEAEYFAPFLNHATMEPQTCTAWVKDDGTVETWVPTQNGEASMATASETAGVPLEKVEVHKTMLGGGFGRRGAFQDYVRQAVQLSKAAGNKPVKLLWSREEDMQHGFYRPASLIRMKAAFDAGGNVTAMTARVACPSILAGVRPEAARNGMDGTSVAAFNDFPYSIPHFKADYAMRNTHVPVGFWRGVGQSQNGFFRECFIDEMAHAAGKDPLEFRRALLKDSPKNLAVLEAVAKAGNWGAPLPAGVGRGIAVQDGYGSFTAAVVEASVSANGEIKLLRCVTAIDSGYVVNPDTCRAQAESAVVYGLSAALYGENTIKDGRVQQSNFHDYPVMKLADMPKCELVLVPSGGFWGGHGEPGLIALAPALGNAIFAATGKRLRSMPFKNHDLKKA
jgi:isoquinoline 1-oxidoreductase beta subunit